MTSINGNGTTRGPRHRKVGRRVVPGRSVTPDEISHAANTAIKNGAVQILNIMDRRSLLARRYKSIIGQLLTDQGDGISEARMQLLQRFAGCCVLAEQSEVQAINGGTIDLGEYNGLISSLVRVASRIGIDRVPKTVSRNLKDYLSERSTIDADDGDTE